MPSILVVEHEARYRERVRDALAAEGWSVEGVADVEAAWRATSSAPPLLVLAASDLSGVASLLARFSQKAGGPGAVAMQSEQGPPVAPGTADEILVKPFTDQDVRLVVRRCLNAAARAATAAAAGTHRLTSQELFGDMLAEVEESAPAPPPKPAPAPASPPSGAHAAQASLGGDLDRKLERTLSGLMSPAARPARPATKSDGMDDLISRTLSGLDAGVARKSAPPAPAKPAAPAAPPPAAPAAAAPPAAAKPPAAKAPAPPPAAAPKPAPAPPAPVAAPPPPAPAPEKSAPPAVAPVSWEAPALPEVHLPPIAAAPAPAPSMAQPAPPPPAPPPVAAVTAAAPPAPPRAAPPVPPLVVPTPTPKPSAPAARRTGEIDLSQLEELARPRTKSGSGASGVRPAPDLFSTQRLEAVKREPAPGEPREFGQYTLLDRIALGGMAEVWKARRRGVEGFQKTVAIKRILPHLTDSVDFVTMFIDEAKLAAQLTHNNIIHIYDLGKIGEDYFIAMEYVEGKDLRSILNAARNQGRPLPMGLALLIAGRLASALDYAHRKRDFDNRELGLVHRDVSPQNVLIGYEGDIKLCDFGIVKAVSKASRTQMGALKGKLQYMSPEQAWGKSVDSRSDIFSLSVLLFEMLTGKRLFTGESEISVLEAVRDGRLQRPRDLVPTIPVEVDALVVKALAKDPDDRYQTAGQMQKEIERILHGLHPAPTPADLGAYMHKLFGAEARDSGSMAPSEPGTGAGQPAPAAAMAAASAAPGAVVAAMAPQAGASAGEESEGKGKLLLYAAVAAAVLVGAGLYFWFGRTPAGPETVAPPAVQQTADPAAAVPEAPVAPAPAVDPAAAPAAPATGEVASTPAPPALTPAQQASATLAAQQEELRRLESEKRRLEAQNKTQAAAAPPAAAPAPAIVTPPAADPTPPPAAAAPVETPAAPAPVVSDPEPAPVEAAPAPPAPAPKPNVGDLVRMGPGVVPPALVSSPNPSYPSLARSRNFEGTVTLQVLVDETGVVRETKVVKGQGMGLTESALDAAKRARFRPATKDGVAVKMWHTLNFPFKL